MKVTFETQDGKKTIFEDLGNGDLEAIFSIFRDDWLTEPKVGLVVPTQRDGLTVTSQKRSSKNRGKRGVNNGGGLQPRLVKALEFITDNDSSVGVKASQYAAHSGKNLQLCYSYFHMLLVAGMIERVSEGHYRTEGLKDVTDSALSKRYTNEPKADPWGES